MISILALLVLSQPQPGLNLNVTPIESRAGGVKLSNQRQYGIDCRANMTCTVDGGWLYLAAAAGGGGGGDGGGVGSADGGTAVPLGAPFVTWQADGTLTSSRVITGGTNVGVSNATPGQTILSVTGTVASSSTAAALDADPTDCSAGQYATAIASSGNLTCTQPGFSNLSGTATIPQGGTGVTSRAANDLVVGTGVNATAAKVLPSCSNATNSKLLFDNSTQTFSCGTDQTSAGGGYATIQDEAAGLTARTIVNFTGAGVSCVDNAGATRTDCTIAGGSGSANVVEASIDFTDSGFFSVVITGQTWVTATSKIVCAPFGTTVDGLTPEAIAIADLQASWSDPVVGTGFTLNVFNPAGLEGTVRFHCTGA